MDSNASLSPTGQHMSQEESWPYAQKSPSVKTDYYDEAYGLTQKSLLSSSPKGNSFNVQTQSDRADYGDDSSLEENAASNTHRSPIHKARPFRSPPFPPPHKTTIPGRDNNRHLNSFHRAPTSSEDSFIAALRAKPISPPSLPDSQESMSFLYPSSRRSSSPPYGRVLVAETPEPEEEEELVATQPAWPDARQPSPRLSEAPSSMEIPGFPPANQRHQMPQENSLDIPGFLNGRSPPDDDPWVETQPTAGRLAQDVRESVAMDALLSFDREVKMEEEEEEEEIDPWVATQPTAGRLAQQAREAASRLNPPQEETDESIGIHTIPDSEPSIPGPSYDFDKPKPTHTTNPLRSYVAGTQEEVQDSLETRVDDRHNNTRPPMQRPGTKGKGKATATPKKKQKATPARPKGTKSTVRKGKGSSKKRKRAEESEEELEDIDEEPPSPPPTKKRRSAIPIPPVADPSPSDSAASEPTRVIAPCGPFSYPGTVVLRSAVDRGKYAIEFEDSTLTDIELALLRKLEIRPGDHVIQHPDGWTGVVKTVLDFTYEVLPDQGGKAVTIPLEQIKFDNRVTLRWTDRTLRPCEIVPSGKYHGPNSRNTPKAPSALATASPAVSVGQKRKSSSSARKDGLFSAFRFLLTSAADAQAQEHRHEVDALIKTHGGDVISGWEDVLDFTPSRRGTELELLRSSVRWTKTGNNRCLLLIADSFVATPKYLTAIALGVPCVSAEWIQSSAAAGELAPLQPHLLPRGSHNGITYSQAIDLEWIKNFPRVDDIMKYDVPSKPFGGETILFVYGDQPAAIEKAKNLLSIIVAMGAERVTACAKFKPKSTAQDWSCIICMDKIPKELGKAAHSQRTVGTWEWARQCLIQGRQTEI